jgi:hypothetical protein
MLLFYVITISMLFIFKSTSLLLANSPFDLNIGVPVQMTFSQLSLTNNDNARPLISPPSQHMHTQRYYTYVHV